MLLIRVGAGPAGPCPSAATPAEPVSGETDAISDAASGALFGCRSWRSIGLRASARFRTVRFALCPFGLGSAVRPS